MPLSPLADVSDLPAGTSGDTDRALRVASAAVRDAARVSISRATSTVVVDGGRANLLRLPGPVISVATVLIDGTAVTDFETLSYGLWRHCGWGYDPKPITVTYTHGLLVVPDDVIDLVVDLALAWLTHRAEGGGSTAGLKSVRLDDGAETYTDEAAGQVSPVFIPEVTRNWLARRFGGGVEVVETL